METELNNVWQLGRAQTIEERQGKEALVFKDVFAGGCRSCIKLYTTDGIGSKPRVFKLSELQANGDNIGKKQTDWLPVIGSTHPHCFNSKSTKILTSIGFKNISDIVVGDLVLTHKGRFRKVTELIWTKISDRKDVKLYNIKYEFKSNAGIWAKVTIKRITGNHPILTNGGWKDAENLS